MSTPTLLDRLKRDKKLPGKDDVTHSQAPKQKEEGQAPKRATPPPRATNDVEEEPKRATPPPRSQSSAEIMREQSQLANVDKSVQFVDVDLIDVETQVRKKFDQDYIRDLCLDFIANDEAPFQPEQPVTLYARGNGRYLLEAGENRLRAVLFGRENKEALGITDPTAFTIIRATIKSNVPAALKKTQKQVKENVLRSDLTYAELAQALVQFFKEHPKATQADAVEWCGFRNANSGRVKVNKALKLLECDKDLQAAVANDELSIAKAFEQQELRKKEVTQPEVTDKPEEKPKAKKTPAKKHQKTQSSISVSSDTLNDVLQVLGWAASQAGIDWAIPENPTRKEVLALLNSPELQALKEKAK